MASGLLMHVFWALKVQWQCKMLLLKLCLLLDSLNQTLSFLRMPVRCFSWPLFSEYFNDERQTALSYNVSYKLKVKRLKLNLTKVEVYHLQYVWL